MLSDRPYMRDDRGYRSWSVSGIMMVMLVGIFALQCINDVYVQSLVEHYLAVTPLVLLRGYVWQLFTFQFLHVDILHLLGNLLGLWFIGRFIENVVGRNRFLLLYLGSGVAGGLLQATLMVLFPQHFAPFVFGASAGVLGVLAVFCKLEAASEIRVNFVIPIRADVLLWISLAISLFFTLVPSTRGGFVAHAAHLGGLLAGMAFVKLQWHQDFRPLPWAQWWQNWRSRVRVVKPPRDAAPPRLQLGQPLPKRGADFMAAEVDPILEKISAHGIHSLTAEERAILDRAQKRMSKH